jgi:hypothetical protein
MSAGSDGGTATPRKNNPNDFLFGRIIGEGELFYVLKSRVVDPDWIRIQ